VTDRPALGVLELSESFHAVWRDLADEAGAELLALEAGTPPDGRLAAVILAAGGEEERALDTLRSVEVPPDVPILVVGARTTHRFGVEAVRRGAADYLALPDDLDLLRRTVAARVEAARQRRSRPVPPAEGDPFAQLRGGSEALRATLDAARRVAPHGTVTVLLQGETGTGKELLARAIHQASPRQAAAFVAVNCAAIPSELMESELFGHERGAFTDAHAAKPGLFEEADRGTLFLDEIGHLPLPLQGKLLRALEDGRIRRVGATKSRQVDVRIVAATNVDLATVTARGEFREDLFYRLNVVTLTLPPLRSRQDDIVSLAEYFAATLAARYGLEPPRLTDDVVAALRAHSWPGNVRELRHAVERSLLLSAPGTLDPSHLVTRSAPAETTKERGAGEGSLTEIVRQAVRAAVERYGGNKSAAARALGISRTRLARLLEGGEA
jgi:DNA-binding NtrC family response regulator